MQPHDDLYFRRTRARSLQGRAGLAALALLAPWAGWAQPAADAVLRYGTVHPAGSPMFRYSSEYLAQLCKEIRRQCTLEALPGRRSEAMMGDGSLQGEMGRTRQYAQRHAGFVAIDPPLLTLRTRAYTARADAAIDSWEQLAGAGGSVAYPRGVLTYQLRLEAMRPGVTPHDVQDFTACLQMVQTGRDRACIYDDGAVTAEVQQMLAQGHSGAILESSDLHLVLSQSGAALAPAFTQAMQRLQARGVIRQLRRQYFPGVRSDNRT